MTHSNKEPRKISKKFPQQEIGRTSFDVLIQIIENKNQMVEKSE